MRRTPHVLNRVTLALAGSVTIAFAFALRHQLGNAALVLAFSLPGLVRRAGPAGASPPSLLGGETAH